MVDLRPKRCNLCGGKVELVENSKIYGRKYGSGYMYLCTKCGASVGTHANEPDKALGILANEEMRFYRKACHNLFDKQWRIDELNGSQKTEKRTIAYKNLAQKLHIDVEECHFAYFDLKMLKQAFQILVRTELLKPDIQSFELDEPLCGV